MVVLGTDHMGVRRRLTRHFGNSNLDPEDIRTLSVLEVVEGSADGRVEDVWDTLQALEDSCLDGVTNIGFVEVTVRTESSSPRAVSECKVQCGFCHALASWNHVGSPCVVLSDSSCVLRRPHSWPWYSYADVAGIFPNKYMTSAPTHNASMSFLSA